MFEFVLIHDKNSDEFNRGPFELKGQDHCTFLLEYK